MKSDAETTGSKFNRICGSPPKKGRNVDRDERGVEAGRVEIRRPRRRGEAPHVLRGNEVASIQRVARSVEPQTIADVAQKTRDVADVALLLPDAASLRTEVLAVLGGGAVQIDAREFLVVGKGEGVGEVRCVQTVADRNSLGLVRKWEVGPKIARGRINTTTSRIARAIAGVADRKNVSIEIGC